MLHYYGKTQSFCIRDWKVKEAKQLFFTRSTCSYLFMNNLRVFEGSTISCVKWKFNQNFDVKSKSTCLQNFTLKNIDIIEQTFIIYCYSISVYIRLIHSLTHLPTDHATAETKRYRQLKSLCMVWSQNLWVQ